MGSFSFVGKVWSKLQESSDLENSAQGDVKLDKTIHDSYTEEFLTLVCHD